MSFHKFNILSETQKEKRSYSVNRSKEEILEEIKQELENASYYEIRYHKCNHDIPKSCEDEEVVASKGDLPEMKD